MADLNLGFIAGSLSPSFAATVISFDNFENILERCLSAFPFLCLIPAIGEATLCGVIVDCNIQTGLATNIKSYVFGAQLKNTH